MAIVFCYNVFSSFLSSLSTVLCNVPVFILPRFTIMLVSQVYDA